MVKPIYRNDFALPSFCRVIIFPNAMIYLIGTAYFIFMVMAFSFFSRLNSKSVYIGVFTLLLLFVLQNINNQTDFIEEKVASFISYDMHLFGHYSQTFIFQYLLLWVPFQLFDYQYTAHAFNIALQAFMFMLCYEYFNSKNRALNPWILLVLLFPSYYHYSIFGLRDPIINFICLAICIGAIEIRTNFRFFLYCLIFAFISIWIRPEFSLILIGFSVIRQFLTSSKVMKYLICITSFLAFYVVLLFLPLAFGISSTGSIEANIETIVNFNELRHNRRLGVDGSGSHILGGMLFNYPIYIRYPIQIAASFIAPLPFEIRGLLGLYAFIESVLFTSIAIVAFYKSRENKLGYTLFLFGVIYMLLQAFFAINYGNILRIRYPAFIFFIGSICYSSGYIDRYRSLRPQ